MSKRLIALPAGVLAVVLIVAGCGGDSSTPPISKAAFIKKADAICKATNARTVADFAAYSQEKKAEKTGQGTEPDYAGLIATVLAPNVERKAEEIRALGAPKGDEDKVDAMVEGLEEGLEEAEADPKAAIGNPNLFAKANKAAKEYGLENCSE